ncbi:c-type cytochrome domain-containing protein [Spirosoma sp. KUDC1026]|uniref:c-type cytochrome domain-containing protein n=1 Tax=Spirosoma sp. KUDC1026 TaxID=2745947 RepID=UPI00159BB953|nr:c-type cytochrome domain-containing protein [Spirosoma sp. KUDC1026]QKZ12125.1 ribonuclease inhibitor [Spirosoma sp. KUDC1026]
MNGSICLLAEPVQPADWMLFLGHFHPLVVHLPIGFLLIAGLLELDRITRRNTVSSHTITLILFWSAVSATLACVLGYLLSLGGEYEADTLVSHQWLGIGVAVFAWLAWAVKRENLGQKLPVVKRLYLPILSVAIVLLLAAGHQGGNLTHGSDYLTQYAPDPIRQLAGLSPAESVTPAKPITDVNQAMVYEQIISPILQSRCVQCHNADKSKGGLRLDNPEQITKGAKEGPVLVAGSGARSTLIKVCLLPEDDKHHMPPKGKSQLTDSQLALLTWWIDEGAPFTKKVAELTVSETVRPALASLETRQTVPNTASDKPDGPAADSPVLAMNVPAANPIVVAELKKMGLIVLPLSETKNQLEVSAVNVRSFTDAQAAELTKLGEQIVWLKLGETNLSDAGLAQIGKLKNLQKLHLEQTKVTDAGLKYLTDLTNLEYLNLYGTSITDAGLVQLSGLKSLKTVYLWQTKVTPSGIATLQKARPQLTIIGGINEQEVADFVKTTSPEEKKENE